MSDRKKGIKDLKKTFSKAKEEASSKSSGLLKNKDSSREKKLSLAEGEKKTEKEELKEKLDQAHSDNLYLRAEFENFKKRTFEEKRKLILYSGESFISALANEVLDDLDRAVFSVKEEKDFENLKKGLEIIQKKLSQVLKNFGIEILDPTGKEFDPSYQEAISYIPSSKVSEGSVVEAFKKAYKLHGKVIRPAQVVIAKSKEED